MPETLDAKTPDAQTALLSGVSPDTLVMTNEGLIAAGRLLPALGRWGREASAGLPSPQPPLVRGALRRGSGRLLQTECGDILRVADGQSLLAIDSEFRLALRPACELAEGDLLVLDQGRAREAWSRLPLVELRKIPIQVTRTKAPLLLPRFLDERVAGIMGLFVGNGDLGSVDDPYFRIGICEEDPDLVSWLANNLRGMGVRPSFWYARHCVSVQTRRKDFVNWLVANDVHKQTRDGSKPGSASAHIPEAVLRSPSRVAVASLAAYFSTDGSAQLDDTVTVSASSVSRTLTTQNTVLLRHLGLRIKARTYKPAKESWLPLHEIRIADAQNADRFGRRIGFLGERKQDAMRKARLPAEKFATRHHSIAHPALFDDLRLHADGIDPETRHSILARGRQGFCNQEWLWRTIEAHPQLQQSKAAKLRIEDLDYVAIKAITPVRDQEWVALATPMGEPVFGNAFALATSQAT